MITAIEKTIRDYLPEVIHMSLASVQDNRPWICEVHYVYDEYLNLYFRSKAGRRHSLEIAENPQVAGNIVKQHELGEKPRGVYFEGICNMLEGVSENDPAYLLYCERFGTSEEILVEAKKPDGHKFYKVQVDTYYLFDSLESNPSQKYELPWRKEN